MEHIHSQHELRIDRFEVGWSGFPGGCPVWIKSNSLVKDELILICSPAFGAEINKSHSINDEFIT